ncbi:hypothetical protein DTO027B5_3995 [Paecilomyces variotii]|nr:hypothetical protein DTO169E5_1623 [Paecilomyces variotii]KAJ9247210.1 hypothetical protein DTO207G8_8269 [Paecilomyces variotii]KAJ9265940.1 hypothetical protein DTO195F2_1542 [Paecilomyces variotii]KAJ9291797.1 hypothetical protein DTO021C3_698 [Paecilomyces variotii]KAJ9321204.1 hypothetical protein DTO027B3_7776 [Paecilomyces variotii]
MRFSAPPTPTGFQSRSRRNTGLQGVKHHQRTGTHPLLLSSRRKPRRWPLVLRFIKGAVHAAIIVPVMLHGLFTALVVCLDTYVFETVGLPSTIIPSLSIVVGLMLVFRNQTSYNRFWDGRNAVSTTNSCIRNLVRMILTNSYSTNGPLTQEEKEDVERTVRVLIALPFALKNYLRSEWGAWQLGATWDEVLENGAGPIYNPEYASLLPVGLQALEDKGLGLPFELTFFVDSFVKRGVDRGWFHAPGASQMQAQLNTLTDAYGKMETIKLTPIPVAHLIHQKQVLALYGCVLPFAMVDDMGWWTVAVCTLIMFTFYGIEGIASQLEDPFGYDRNDIKMDAIVLDTKTELDVILAEWRKMTAATETVPQTSSSGANSNPTNGAQKKYRHPDIIKCTEPSCYAKTDGGRTRYFDIGLHSFNDHVVRHCEMEKICSLKLSPDTPPHLTTITSNCLLQSTPL